VLGLPILMWDERWSTASAERGLIDQDMSRAKRKTRIDSAAAAVILQAACDAMAGGMRW
jgi:putative Holliday junction resolvase